MAIKVYGDKIVFPDNTEQTTAADSADTSYTKAEIDAQQEAQDVQIESKAPEAPVDGETYARNNKTWVSITDTAGIPDAPVDGLMYGRKDGEWDTVADAGDFYTKGEIDAQQKVQDDDIIENNDDIARQQIEISNQQTSIDKNTNDIDEDSDRITANANNITTNTSNIAKNTSDIETNKEAIAAIPTTVDAYTKAESDAIDGAQDDAISANTTAIADTYTKAEIDADLGGFDSEISANRNEIATNKSNISSNTTAIGTLSGQVIQNTEDISELQDSIFFTSAYSANYPDAPNRDPEDGGIYLQNVALFTYSYAEATQIFVSKTDESGNVRQFTAVKPGDSVVLNQVSSPNYGRYELVSIEDVSGSYVVMNVVPKLGEGTIIEGVKVAFQAFPKPGTDSIWTEVAGDAVYDGKAIATSFKGDGSELTGLPSSELDIESLPALPTTLEGTDLFVTERTGTNYKITADELKG